MKYKALFLDVDGTLVVGKADAMPTKRVKTTILRAKDFIHIGVATSRPYSKMKDICDELSLTGPSIMSGGSQIIDAATGNVLREYPIDKQYVEPVCKIIEKYNVDFWIQDNGTDYKFNSTYIPNKPFVIVASGMDNTIADQIIFALAEVVSISPHKVPSYRTGKFDVHMTNALATKEHAIKEIAEILRIETDEIIGVGDGYNDIPLLKNCGLKVAMGNAVPELKAMADYIAPSVDEDGVADAIEKYILIK